MGRRYRAVCEGRAERLCKQGAFSASHQALCCEVSCEPCTPGAPLYSKIAIGVDDTLERTATTVDDAERATSTDYVLLIIQCTPSDLLAL